MKSSIYGLGESETPPPLPQSPREVLASKGIHLVESGEDEMEIDQGELEDHGMHLNVDELTIEEKKRLKESLGARGKKKVGNLDILTAQEEGVHEDLLDEEGTDVVPTEVFTFFSGKIKNGESDTAIRFKEYYDELKKATQHGEVVDLINNAYLNYLIQEDECRTLLSLTDSLYNVKHGLVSDVESKEGVEKYVVPENVYVFIDKLIENSTESAGLRTLRYELTNLYTKERVLKLLEEAKENSILSVANFFVLQGLINRPESPHVEPEEEIIPTTNDGAGEDIQNEPEKPHEEEIGADIVMPSFAKDDGVVPDMPEIPPVEQVAQTNLSEALGNPVSTELPPPLPTEESFGLPNLDKHLMEARAEYASQMVDYKNKLRGKKSILARLKSQLGVEDTQMPEADMPPELLEARRVYTEAKKHKHINSVFSSNLDNRDYNPAQASASEHHALKEYSKALGKVEARVNPETGETLPGFEINPKLVDLSEDERNVLQSKIVESMHPRERGIISKAVGSFSKLFQSEKAQSVYAQWEKLSPTQRILARNVIAGLTVGSVAFALSGVTLTGAVVIGGSRVIRGASGSVLSVGTGILADKFFGYKNEKRQDKALDEYEENLNLDNFEERERVLAEAIDKEEKTKKQQRLIKAIAMIGAGAGTTALFGSVQNASHAFESTGTGRPALDNHLDKSLPKVGRPIVDNIRPKVTDVVREPLERTLPTEEKSLIPIQLRDISDQKISQVAEVIKTPVRVELSSRGFIQTIDDMKEKIRVQYGKNIPVDVQKNILDKSSTELAQKFGFYDAKNGLSGMGLKGEHLGVDSKGNVIYEHGGKTDIISSEHKFTGSMMEAPEERIPTPSQTETAQGPEYIPETPTETEFPETPEKLVVVDEDVPEYIKSPESVVESTSPSNQMFEYAPGMTYQIIDNGSARIVMHENIKIAHVSPVGMLQLEDKFQDGAEHLEMRKMYVNALSRVETPQGVIPFKPISFEGGVAQVVMGDNTPGGNPKTLRVFMNGKQIAQGLVTDKGPQISIDKSFRSGFWYKDTVYERAFKAVKPALKTLKYTK